jgi:tRNA pseudouridine55 synthase
VGLPARPDFIFHGAVHAAEKFLAQLSMAKRNVNGVLLFDKPFGLSSNGVLTRLKILYNAAKAGHTGTLDPFATGLLPVCFGEATKFAGYMLDADKAYRATVKLGFISVTGDSEGPITPQQTFSGSLADVEQALQKFTGPLIQMPPMHSALKHQGRPLYELAREGIEIERKPRAINIYRLTLLALREDELDIDVSCSKGTYIRVLAQDIGTALGCGGYLSALRRTATGGFPLASAYSSEQLMAMSSDERDGLLLPAETLVAALPRLSLSPELARKLSQGQKVKVDLPIEDKEKTINNQYVTRVYEDGGRFCGLVQADQNGVLVPLRMMAE